MLPLYCNTNCCFSVFSRCLTSTPALYLWPFLGSFIRSWLIVSLTIFPTQCLGYWLCSQISSFFVKFVDLISFYNFQQIIDFSTAASGILDLVLVNPKTEVISCKKINLDISLLSNHDAIALKFRVKNLSSSYLRESKSKIVYSFFKAKFDEMNKQITELPFHGFCWSNINVLLEQWYDWIRPIIFENVLKRTMHRSQLSPWIKPPTSNAITRLETVRRNNANNIK